MDEKQIAVLKRAIEYFGVNFQLGMATEECAELIQAINKLKRKGVFNGNSIQKPCQEMNLKQISVYNNLCSEVADCKIILAEMELMLCKETIQISVNRKIDRLEKEINELEKVDNQINN